MSVAAHLALLPIVVLGIHPELQAVAVPPTPIVVSLAPPFVPPPPPPTPPRPAQVEDPAPAAGPPAPQPATAPARPLRLHRPVAPAAPVPPLTATLAEAPPAPFPQLTGAQLAGARTAGGGGGAGAGGEGEGAGGCDMVRRLEQTLKRDRDVMAAVNGASAAGDPGSALYVWNGDWVRSPSQSGKGLAGVRQAIALEVAFAPEPCRREPMRGLVLLSLGGGARVALGADAWRWTDLLAARR